MTGCADDKAAQIHNRYVSSAVVCRAASAYVGAGTSAGDGSLPVTGNFLGTGPLHIDLLGLDQESDNDREACESCSNMKLVVAVCRIVGLFARL
jgi:hypothetical protein